MGRPIKHGHRRRLAGRSKEWSAWDHMKGRCYNPKNASYSHYGANGIKVCKRWRDSFPAFLKDVGPAPSPKHSLDRFPNRYGNYKPGNVRWATGKEQQRNRTNTVMISAFGQSKALMEWAEIYKINPSSLRERVVVNKWPAELALTTPVKTRIRNTETKNICYQKKLKNK